uniref:G-protein coupled receptors family 2 profile 2 domain-containing protein n=1 Tax=Anopheles epiroticus TaxID=199890 RepID=A0A182PLA5_9DIPT
MDAVVRFETRARMQARIFGCLLVLFGVRSSVCSLPCDFIDSVNITDGQRLPNDEILHNGVIYNKTYYRVIDYEYVDYATKKYVPNYIRGCLCAVRICVRLCCGEREYLGKRCTPTDEYLPVLVNVSATETIDLRNHSLYGFLYGKPCEQVYELLPEESLADEWSIARNGSLIIAEELFVPRNQYCLAPRNNNGFASGLVCFTTNEEFKYHLYPVGMLLSVPFLLLTFFVYACIPDLRNMHGKSLMCYVLGLSVGYTVLSMVQLRVFPGFSPSCVISGYIVYFSFMVSFFWLNVMSFDIYWTFKGVTGVRNSETKKFLLYSLYAWGCPILLVATAITADNTDILPIYLRPQFGTIRCLFVENKLIEFLYLYMPLLILVFMNVVFFVITALRIYKIQCETSVVRRGDSKRHTKLDNDRDRFGLYLRLFIVMGVTWSLEIISWAVDNNAWIFYVSDVCNCIQGFLIFALFVLKQKIKRLIYKKFGIREIRQEQKMSSCSTRTTATMVSSYQETKSDNPLVTRESNAIDVEAARLCPLAESIDISGGFADAEGTIEHEGVRYGSKQYFRDENSTVWGCVCLVRQCLHICCENATRQGEPCPMESLNVNFWLSEDGTVSDVRDLLVEPNYHLLYSMPECSGTLLTLEGDEYVLRSDGLLAYGPSTYDYRHYCLQATESNALAGYCETIDAYAMHRMYSIGIFVSLPFLVATFVVYALLPEMQNVPGMSLMCYVASLIVSYLLVGLMRFNAYRYQSGWCIASGYIVYMALLASFFWLNVMAFDIFWTFGGSRGRSSERRKFLYYSLYAWGAPLLIVGFATLVDNTDFIHESMRPQIGQERCFVSEERLIGFLYMYLPMLVLVSANVVFFAVTAFRIFRMEQATASALSGESRRHTKYEKDRNRYSLYLRLFVIMGVTWTVEIITFWVGERSWLIYLVDICNCLTGIFIFVLFVWKQKVKQLLLKSLNRASWTENALEEVDLRESSEYWLIYSTPPAWNSMPGYSLQISGHEGELFDDGSFAYGAKVYASRTYCINPTEDSTPHVWIKETDEHLEVHRWHSLGMIISIPFLLATLLVYALIPDLRNIPGKSLMCYVFTLTVSYLALILIKRSVFDDTPDWCTAIGYSYYFSVMSSFFWLNLMAFDIFWTFGGRRRRTTDQGKFLLYCCYGFGCPLIFLAIALLADHTDVMYTSVRPGFGDGQCLFKGERFVSFLYLYLPLVLLVSSNLFFFISTAAKINSIERTTAAALQGESGRHSKYANERNRYGLYVRLFVVMGVTWTFEFITWITDAQNWLAYVTDICNCICGVFIFFLFVWKRKVWQLLQQRLSGKAVRKYNQPLFSVSGTRTTSVAPARSPSALRMDASSF